MSNDFPMLPAWAWRKAAMEDEEGWPGMKPMLDRIENRARELTAAQPATGNGPEPKDQAKRDRQLASLDPLQDELR